MPSTTAERLAAPAARGGRADPSRGPQGEPAGTPPRVSISVIMPVRQEAGHMRESLAAVLSQDASPDTFEVLVVDGQSTDGTPAIVRELSARDPRLRLLDNPGRIVPTAMNIGLRAARGEFIVRVDGHCLPEPGYLRAAVETLRRTGCEGVGGTMVATGTGFWSRAIAAATSTPFGVGNARFHYSDREGEADTVYLGAYRRDHLLALGGYDPAFVRNQDDELNYRLRARGGRVFFTPAMRAVYRVRPSLAKLFSQYFQYGLWKVPMYRKTGHRVQWRHLAPPVFVLALLGSLALGAWRPAVLWVPAGVAALHLAAGAAQALRAPSSGTVRLALPVVFLTLHAAYGLGFLAGLFRPAPTARGSRTIGGSA